MKRKRRWTVQRAEGNPPTPNPGGPAFAAQRRGEDSFQWPAAPKTVVRVTGLTEGDYAIDVELVADDQGELVPVGISVRRTFPTSRHKKRGEYVFTDDARLEQISAVDLRKVPIGRAIRAALTAASGEIGEDHHAELEEIIVPKGRPRRGKSIKWYRELLKVARAFENQGISPAKEIARRKGVTPNLVHQWLHVARGYERQGLFNG